MYRRILVPVDGSDASNAGLQHAVQLAKDQKAELRVLHVVHDYLIADGRHAMTRSVDLLNDLRAQGQQVLAAAAASAAQHGVQAGTEAVESPLGPVGAVISEYAATYGADLIVIGTHGRRGLRRLVMGSDAEYVVRTSTMPVLLVHGAKDVAGG